MKGMIAHTLHRISEIIFAKQLLKIVSVPSRNILFRLRMRDIPIPEESH